MTARAIQLLAAADVYASESRTPRPRRGWHDPAIITIVLAMVTLVVLAFSYLRLSQVGDKLTSLADENHRLTQQNTALLHQVDSCVNPQGDCSQRGAENTGKAVESIVAQITAAICRAVNPDNDTAFHQCVARAANAHP